MVEIKGSSLHWADVVVILGYFVGVLAVGLLSSYWSKRDSVKGYFLASRSMHWIPVGASLFASNIGSGHFVGLAGSAAASGIAVATFELNAMFVLMILGWIFVPVYMAAQVYTMPEYLRKRFGGQRIRLYLSFLALILYVFTKISADLYAGAIFIEQALSWDLYVSVISLLAIAALFTISGGLTAVIWTDFVQTILMLVGSFILMIIAFIEVGGYNNLTEKFFYAMPANGTQIDPQTGEYCGKPPADSMNFFRKAVPGNSDSLPWTGITFGLTISAVWYWCSDQVIVQRALASKNMSHAKGGCILAAYLKFTPLFLLVFPGMAARVLYPDQVACADAKECEDICGNPNGCTNIAYPLLVLNLMPVGLRGMMLAVMMAALMSSLTSIFNSSSTIFTMDIWTRIRKRATETELLLVGRLFVVVLVVVSILWIPIIQASRGSQLFDYIQSITSFLAPPICAVYVLAISVKRVNEPGAFWGLMIGLAVGLARFVMEFAYTVPGCGSDEEDPRPNFIARVHYLHFGCILFLISLVATLVVSYMTNPIPESHLHRLLFINRFSKSVRVDLEETDEKLIKEKAEREERRMRAAQEYVDPSKLPWTRKIFNFICGINPNAGLEPEDETPKMSPEEEASKASDFLIEDPFWKNVVNFNAVICMVCGAFVFGFFA